jgi:uncharacterized protein
MIIKAFSSLEAIQENEWSQLSSPNFPFADYAYLTALEKSGSVGSNTGWTPLYLTASRGASLEGASYLYSKDNSYGEYIFDWAWVQAYDKYHVPYFPKLLSAIPFTPATGPKILISPGAHREKVAEQLISAALQKMEDLNHTSLHYLFLAPEEIGFFEKAGFLIRHSFQYHWTNQGYASFRNFVDSLKPRKRKQILREREQLQEEKLTIRELTGDALTVDHARLFYGFYLSTIMKMGAIPYLTENFFVEVFQSMRDQIVLFLAEKEDEAVAGSVCYFKGSTLYGRYWGSTHEVRNLHFEMCYYRPIEWAIAHGIKLFEAGAQGEHKIPRGFLPALTYSAHWIRHSEFREAISRFLAEEKNAIRDLFEEMERHSPYK